MGAPGGLRIRPDLIISWSPDGQPLAEQALSGRKITITTSSDTTRNSTLLILALFRPGMTAEDLHAELTAMNCDVCVTDVTEVLDNLLAAGILADGQQDDAECELADRVLGDETWGAGGRWGAPAARFHWASRYPGSGEPPRLDKVPVFQRYLGAHEFPLPPPGPPPAVLFATPLTQRRTIRRFAAQPLDLQVLSDLLYHVQYPQHLVWSEPYGWLPRRAYANGGARGELELYVLARNVTGLSPGIWHYQASDHKLACLGPDPGDDYLLAMGAGQEWCAEAPVHFIVTGVPGRCSAKYATPRALRVMYADAGCLTQLLAMTATALGLGAYETMAFFEEDAERAADVDPVRETPLILLGAGIPGEQDPEEILPCSPGVPLPPELVEDIPLGRP